LCSIAQQKEIELGNQELRRRRRKEETQEENRRQGEEEEVFTTVHIQIDRYIDRYIDRHGAIPSTARFVLANHSSKQ